MNRKVLFFAVLFMIIMLFSACDAFTFNSAENLVRPPKLSGDDGELQAAFEKAVSSKGEYILKYPSGGDYRSAFVRYDCDGDGNDEAFVFYSLKTEEMSVYMYILDYENGEWTPVDTFPGDGNDIYSIEFSDLNNDGTAEILVGWNAIESKTNKKLSVYCSYNNSGSNDYKVLLIETYTGMLTVDLDNDGQTEILTALINSTSDNYTTEARLLKMSGADSSQFQIEAVGQVSLYSEITAFSAINSGVSDGRTYIYIDEVAGDTYLTEMLYWDSDKNVLAAPIEVNVLSVYDCPTSRSVALNSTDIDGDGELEIPSTRLLQNSSVIRKSSEAVDNLSQTENVYITLWNKYNGGDFVCVSSYIENSDNKFRIDYDDVEMKDWSVVFYPDEGLSQFFINKKSDDPQQPQETELLFSITAVDVDETVSINSYLFTGEDFKYIYEITAEGAEIGITKTDIASSFTLLSQEVNEK